MFQTSANVEREEFASNLIFMRYSLTLIAKGAHGRFKASFSQLSGRKRFSICLSCRIAEPNELKIKIGWPKMPPKSQPPTTTEFTPNGQSDFFTTTGSTTAIFDSTHLIIKKLSKLKIKSSRLSPAACADINGTAKIN